MVPPATETSAATTTTATTTTTTTACASACRHSEERLDRPTVERLLADPSPGGTHLVPSSSLTAAAAGPSTHPCTSTSTNPTSWP